ncbi:MAG: hypothetical protein EZS28_023521 [Streblomastix strix]|uniref:Transmembrane protein n=1 Tax=Streblomastix strix TaxID=222440 RepID=A0A5J4VER4_9EUKA|nr:MAG: hypothetical protein EZS28_023521 [Streblomastix strix]
MSIYAHSQILKFINLAVFSSLAYVVGKSSIYISIAFCLIPIIIITMELIITSLHRIINTSQPCIIYIMQTIIAVCLQVLFIPSLNRIISTFDYFVVHEIALDGSQLNGIFWLGLNNIRYLSGKAIEIILAVLSTIFILVIFFYNSTIQPFKFNHKLNSGGLFECSSGCIRGLHIFLLLGIVFCKRELIDLPFFRGIVSAGTFGLIIVIILLKQPFYKFISNYLNILPWSLFGEIRLCVEIDYQFQEFEIALFIFIHSVLNRKMRKKWLLASELRTIVDIEKQQIKKKTAQKFRASFDFDPLSGQNQNQTIPSSFFGQQGCWLSTQSYASSFKKPSGIVKLLDQLSFH